VTSEYGTLDPPILDSKGCRFLLEGFVGIRSQEGTISWCLFQCQVTKAPKLMELVVSSGTPQLRGKNCCFYSQMNKHYLIHVHLQVFRDNLDEAANFTRPKMDSSVGGFRIRYALGLQSLHGAL